MPARACRSSRAGTAICCICSAIHQVAVAVNKMDLVGYSAKRGSARSRDEYVGYLARPRASPPVCVVPISAREGDNIAARSAAMPWYAGPDAARGAGRVCQPAGADRAAAAPAGAGRLQVRRAPHHRRPDRERLAEVGDKLVFSPQQQDRARQARSRPGTRRTPPVGRRPGNRSASPWTSRSSSSAARSRATTAMRRSLTNVFRARLFWLGCSPLRVGETTG